MASAADLSWDEIARRAHQLLDAMGVDDATRQLDQAQNRAIAHLATLDERTVNDMATLLSRRPARRVPVPMEQHRRPA